MTCLWAAFIAFVLLMLALDLGVFHRKAHVVSVKEALAWSALWWRPGLRCAVARGPIGRSPDPRHPTSFLAAGRAHT
jgi:hypothetical protein